MEHPQPFLAAYGVDGVVLGCVRCRWQPAAQIRQPTEGQRRRSVLAAQLTRREHGDAGRVQAAAEVRADGVRPAQPSGNGLLVEGQKLLRVGVVGASPHRRRQHPTRRAGVENQGPHRLRSPSNCRRAKLAPAPPAWSAGGLHRPGNGCRRWGSPGFRQQAERLGGLQPLNSPITAEMDSLASPNSMRVFSPKNSGLSTPAKPEAMERLRTNTVRA